MTVPWLIPSIDNWSKVPHLDGFSQRTVLQRFLYWLHPVHFLWYVLRNFSKWCYNNSEGYRGTAMRMRSHILILVDPCKIIENSENNMDLNYSLVDCCLYEASNGTFLKIYEVMAFGTLYIKTGYQYGLALCTPWYTDGKNPSQTLFLHAVLFAPESEYLQAGNFWFSEKP